MWRDELMTVGDAAKVLKVRETDLRLMIRQGVLRAWMVPLTRVLLVRRSDLIKLKEPSHGE